MAVALLIAILKNLVDDQRSRFLVRRKQMPRSCYWKWQLTFVFPVYSRTWKVTKPISVTVLLEGRPDICLGACEINLVDNFAIELNQALALSLNRWIEVAFVTSKLFMCRQKQCQPIEGNVNALFNSLCLAAQQQANLNQNKRVDLGLDLIEPQTLRYN